MSKVNIPPEDRFSRALFGVILVTAAFYSAGKWVAFTLGVLFLLSASQGFCLTCYLYKKFQSKNKKSKDLVVIQNGLY